MKTYSAEADFAPQQPQASKDAAAIASSVASLPQRITVAISAPPAG